MSELKLYMLLLGCKPSGRHIEQHDIFFGIGTSLQELVSEIKAFWPGHRIHVDAWREVTVVEDYLIKIQLKDDSGKKSDEQKSKLFFINLGGYQQNKFEEQHYTMLTVKADKAHALTEAKQTLFFQQNQFVGAPSHVDDKYGIDVDELYQIEEILSPKQKAKYRINLIPSTALRNDPINLGYLKIMD